MIKTIFKKSQYLYNSHNNFINLILYFNGNLRESKNYNSIKKFDKNR